MVARICSVLTESVKKSNQIGQQIFTNLVSLPVSRYDTRRMTKTMRSIKRLDWSINQRNIQEEVEEATKDLEKGPNLVIIYLCVYLSYA